MKIIIEERSSFSRALLISIVLHISVVVCAVAVSRFTSMPKYGSPNSINMVFDQGGNDAIKEPLPPEKKEEKLPEKKQDKEPAIEKTKQTTAPPASSEPRGMIAGAFDAVDSSLLSLEYKESSLNVKIKYSEGWAFLDDNNRSKLDAVTFWNPKVPNSPYVQLKVVDRNLFLQSRYKSKEELKTYIAYYNKEEELEGEVKFEIYLRTETSEDYILTFRVKGHETFVQYKPVFMAMLKSFKFGLF